MRFGMTRAPWCSLASIKAGSLGVAVNKERGIQQRKEFVARNDGHEPRGALVVLVNHRTASASELVAAAIKNLGRGIVMGDPTAGAATIRVLYDLPKGPLRAAPARQAASNRDVIQDVIDGKEPTPSPPPPPVQPERDSELLGLLLATGRLLASGAPKSKGSAWYQMFSRSAPPVRASAPTKTACCSLRKT